MGDSWSLNGNNGGMELQVEVCRLSRLCNESVDTVNAKIINNLFAAVFCMQKLIKTINVTNSGKR